MTYVINELGLPACEKHDYPLVTFGFYYYFLEVLFRNERDVDALELIRRYDGGWLTTGATMFGEHFSLSSLKERPLDYEYEVHGYGTSAHAHFYANVLGVRPAAPGFARMLIAPRPGDLAWARGIAATPQGPVHVSWRQAGPLFAADVRVPEGLRCTVEVPERFTLRDVRINGR